MITFTRIRAALLALFVGGFLSAVIFAQSNQIVSSSAGTLTTSAPFTGAQTWNAGGVAFIGQSLVFTETASAAGSQYFRILGGAAGSTAEYSIGKGGTTTQLLGSTISATTNQLVLGTTNTTTFSATAPAASRTITFDDPLGNDAVVYLAAAQTLTNKTLASSATVPYAAGVAAGYKIARGTITLDGANPSSAATGLATVVSCNVSGPAAAAIPGDDPMGATPFINTTNLDIYAWKTDGADPTPAASDNATAVFYWVCVGT